MKTVGEFLTDCGQRLAPFERPRVGKTGCGIALLAIAAMLGLIAAGFPDVEGSWARGFRLVVLGALGAVIVAFVIYAAAELLVERAVWRQVEEYVRSGGSDMPTLAAAAQMRAGSIRGGARLAALFKEMSKDSRSGSSPAPPS